MKIVFIGCVQFSYSLLEDLINHNQINIVGIITRKSSLFNADFKSLQPLAIDQGIPCFIDEGNNQDEMASWMQNLNPDVVYCFGWPYLLRKNILNIPSVGVVGYHPAALPLNRGRHPIIWAIALGLTETASTFFFMDEGADSGDILHQESIIIKKDDDAMDVYRKLLIKAKQQLMFFTEQLINRNYRRIPQEHSKANYWRKRTKEDGKIDWRMSAVTIFNLVRALSKPYVGAHCVYKNMEIKIWKTEEIHSFVSANIEPGKILESANNTITVKCGDSAIKIVQHDFPELPQVGEYL